MEKRALAAFEKDTTYLGRAVWEFARDNDIAKLSVGKYPLAEGGYVVVSEYDARSNEKFEAHKKYIDVQMLVEGEEDILCAPLAAGEVTVPYNEEKDVTFYSCNKQITTVHIGAFESVILMPEDLHAPNNCKTHNKKVLFKIPVDKL